MKFILVSLKDTTVDRYQGVSTARATGEAIRNLQDAINDPRNETIYKHPDDFTLYQVGDFDDVTGVITPYDPPLQLINGKQLKGE